jgi:hypothetical protein
MTDRDRRIQTAINIALYRRNYRRVRDRALAKLSRAYPETYKELLEQEKISDEQLGKKWLDIDGSTEFTDGIYTDSASPDPRGSEEASAGAGSDEGNNGGEA